MDTRKLNIEQGTPNAECRNGVRGRVGISFIITSNFDIRYSLFDIHLAFVGVVRKAWCAVHQQTLNLGLCWCCARGKRTVHQQT
jgi:hypothetical protein